MGVFVFFCGCGGWGVGKGKGKVPAALGGFFFVGVVGGGEDRRGGERREKRSPWGRDRESFLANGEGDGERRTMTLKWRR